MAFATALPSDGRVLTIEKFDHFAEIAIRNFAANGLADKITLVQGDAFEVLGGLDKEDPFDFVFIDGDKERYGEYLRLVEPLLSAEALVPRQPRPVLYFPQPALISLEFRGHNA